MSSLLISKVGKQSRGIKKRKMNDGTAEEDKRDDMADEDDENEDIANMLENASQTTSQFHRSNTMIIKPGGKIIGTRNAKKRGYGQYQYQQSAAKLETKSQVSSKEFKTPQTNRNSM